jgi:hypothetical protein
MNEFMNDFTLEERAAVAARTALLIEEELTLRDLRQAEHLTQVRMAEPMGVEQLRRRDGRQAAPGCRVPEPASSDDCARGHHKPKPPKAPPAVSRSKAAAIHLGAWALCDKPRVFICAGLAENSSRLGRPR